MNHLSIDLESFVHMNLNDRRTSEQRKKADKGWIIRATHKILAVLKKNQTKATFFILGELYSWYPKLIEEIKKEGHEIGFHSFTHRIIQNRAVLIEELEKGREFIKKYKPKGFRAPQMFLTPDCLQLLKDKGFDYDSSAYGNEIYQKEVIEIPVTSIKKISKSLPQSLTLQNLRKKPIGSGFCFALLGKNVLKKVKKDLFMFVHPWQIYKIPLKIKINNIINDPRMILYLRNRTKDFRIMLTKTKFYCFDDFLQNKRR
ncbi:polysaccharide deacetylase family protein [Candidatus Woesearchaeota archaeon]|jgi:peptidoglycan/xylan/chitin deacetylase (PgdA/CDA1 family)|nr:polysaccharide deacetylase family protein [Candidatus Woesearchaeota archaeon]MBT4368832.1 polysaccharide deacetylase family protein [Candidatus Woesearchaeota archaeon]MBT4712121.1 polysaccharide deacetylase family protein [Candidatus Woesearchaeota archaeon]MBT6639131.1 polysaccharide deacetylase family protein [Candidatus Woesearchaeota archaeon]MBT7134331.1 polysaccharide deacetylase family protein [Candidatus Woesearchaeota archaeon]